jgi:alcohol dehydrogenase (NADP+)
MKFNPPSNIRFAKIPLNFGTGAIPALGFGTLIPDPAETRSATTNALTVGFRHFDCAERYRNERVVGESLKAQFATGAVAREDVFITTKLWNTNHRPERVEPAFDASRERLGISYVDLYLIHTPFAFQPGDNMDPRDQSGNIIYDRGVSLPETWRAMENLVDRGKCRAIGLPESARSGV